MKLFVYLARIELIDQLVRQRRTGSPEEFARRLGISVSRLARVLEFLREEGAPIAYDRSAQTYYYRDCFEVRIQVVIGSKKINYLKIN